MQYLVKNITPALNHDGSYSGGKTLWVEGSFQGNCFPIGPQETVVVADTAKELLLKTYPQYVQVIGTYFDDDAPIYKSISLSGTWALVTLAKFCTQFQFDTTATDAQISFSGWDTAAGQTAPPTDYIVTIPTSTSTPGGDLFSITMTMNPSKEFYVKGTGTLTVIGI